MFQTFQALLTADVPTNFRTATGSILSTPLITDYPRPTFSKLGRPESRRFAARTQKATSGRERSGPRLGGVKKGKER